MVHFGEKSDAFHKILFSIWTKYGGEQRTPEEFNKLIRERVPARGERFMHDHHDTFMYIERSKNRNIVAYTANMLDAETKAKMPSGEGCKCVADSKDPIHAYFINIEPAHKKEQEKKHGKGDISELTLLQRKLAYGCTGKPVDLSEKAGNTMNECFAWWRHFDLYKVSYVALSHWSSILLILPPIEESDGSLPVLLFFDDEKLSVMQRVYVKSLEPAHFYQLPKVLYIEIFGTSVDTGEETYIKKEH